MKRLIALSLLAASMNVHAGDLHDEGINTWCEWHGDAAYAIANNREYGISDEDQIRYYMLGNGQNARPVEHDHVIRMTAIIYGEWKDETPEIIKLRIRTNCLIEMRLPFNSVHGS